MEGRTDGAAVQLRHDPQGRTGRSCTAAPSVRPSMKQPTGLTAGVCYGQRLLFRCLDSCLAQHFAAVTRADDAHDSRLAWCQSRVTAERFVLVRIERDCLADPPLHRKALILQ